MAKFGIYSAAGVKKAEGYPTFTGTYMKAGVLDFREIASTTPINWAVGDYVDYTRTGLRYKLYKLPQMKKQARSNTYGGAYVYQSVQFHDASYDLELCPFRDLVKGDNRVHFSTQPMISTFENVAGIANRLQVCLDDMYGSGSWNIRLATVAMGATQAVVDLMNEARNFSVQGVSLIGALEKIYEVWPEIGWVYGVVNGVNTITIGGAGLNLSTSQSYSYGKGSGLKDITRVATNADELANRLYVYGSSRNMMSGWYRSKNIKDAESVDIQHLMIPIANWGTTEVEGVDLPDPAKAFVDDAASIARIGLRPKTIYFDGTGDQEEIYPTIRGMKISDVIAAVPAGNQYSPNTSIYTDTSVRVDTVRSVETNFDSGLSAESGKQTILSEYGTFSENSPIVILAGDKERTVTLYSKVITVPESGIINLSAIFALDGTITASDASLVAYIEAVDSSNTSLGKSYIELTQEGANWRFSDAAIEKFGLTFAQNDTVTIRLVVKVIANAISGVDRQYVVGVDGELSASLERFRSSTFKITIRQIGFDISAQAALGNGKTIHFRTGDCAGRTFTIKNCTYQADTDSWLLEIIRSEDSSLSQWFPNSAYPVAADDEFVLLDIAMPDSYVLVAENKLLAAAQDYLGWSAKEVWQYTPDIDAKFMIEQSRVILPAQYITLGDTDVVDGDADQLVDTVNINEGESTIPTYKVTLRERKRVKTSTSATVEPINSNPVSSATPVNLNRSESSFFEEDGDGNIKLKDIYGGLWTPGFMTAGGIGSGGGGGGDITLADVWRSLTNNPQLTPSDIDHTTPINALHIPIGSGLAIDSQTGNIIVTAQGTVTGVALGSGTTPYSPVNGIITLPAYPTALASPYALTVGSKTYDGSAAVTIDKSDIGLGNVTNDAQVKRTEMGAASGVATLGSDGKVPSSQLPSYVDDVLEYADLAHFPATGESGKIYVALDTNKTYRWSGTAYVEISPSIVIGTTTGTAFDGGSGYSHVTNGDIHVTATQKTAWSAKYDKPNGGIPNTDLANSSITIGSTSISLGGTSTTLAGLTSVTSQKFYLDSNTYFELDSNGYVHLVHPTGKGFYADGFITAGGVGTGGGGGGDATMADVWRSLTNNPQLVPSDITDYTPINVSHLYEFWKSLQNNDIDTSHNTDLIATAHIPDMATTYGYLKSADLSGYVTLNTAQTITATKQFTYAPQIVQDPPRIEYWSDSNTYKGAIGFIGNVPKVWYVDDWYGIWTERNFNPSNYLPLNVGNGKTISGTGYVPIILDTSQSNTYFRLYANGVYKSDFAYIASLGTTVSDVTSNTYVNIDSNGVFRLNNTQAFIHSGGGTFDSGAHISLASTDSYVSDSASYTGGIEVREYKYLQGTTDGIIYGPGITFHWFGQWGNKLWGDISGNLKWGGNTIYNSGNLTKSVLTGLLDASGGYYLPLTGGTLEKNAGIILELNNSNSSGVANYVPFKINGTTKAEFGYYDFLGAYIQNGTTGSTLALKDNGDFKYYSGNSNYDIWHAGNSNLSSVAWACSTLTASTSATAPIYFTNTHCGIGRGININGSLSATDVAIQAYNGSTFDNIYAYCHGFIISGGSSLVPLTINTTAVENRLRLQISGVNKADFMWDSTNGALMNDMVSGNYINVGANGAKYNGSYTIWHGGNSNGLTYGWTCSYLQLNAFDTNETGIYFRNGFNTASTKYNCSILSYDHGGGGSSPDGITISGYDGVSICTGSNTRQERMRVNSNGNVSIGYAGDGGYKLRVQGDMYVSDRVNIMNFLKLGAGGNTIDAMSYDGTTSYNLLLNYTSTGNILMCNGGGKVGIGVASADYVLDVAGSFSLRNDGRVAIYTTANPSQPSSYGPETVCIQTAIDDQDPTTSTLISPYPDRCVLALQPRGGRIGVGKVNPDYTVDVVGVIHSTTGIFSDGYVTAGVVNSSSDARLKDNIQSIGFDRAIDLLGKLRGCEWTWNGKKAHLAGKHGSGLIAQEVEPIMPWAVLDLNGEYSLNYNSFWGVAIPVMQSHEERLQQAEREIADLKRENAQLKARLNA